jgi:hypothetical protein
VGASDSTTASDDPNFLHFLCRVRRALSWGGPRGGQVPPPPLVTSNVWLWVVAQSRQGSKQCPEICFWAVFSILANFVIFSGFLN